MIKVYQWCRKIHKFFAVVVVGVGLFMMVTGLIMKYATVFAGFSFINFILIRGWHNTASVFFSVALACMMLTGAGVYFLPIIIKHRRKKIAVQSGAEEIIKS